VRIAATVAAVYALYLLALFFLQRDMIFVGRRRGPAPEAPSLQAGIERIWLDVDGGRVGSYYWPASQLPAPALIFAHGNAGLIEGWPRSLTALRDLGLSPMMVEYPGYGRSGGSASEASIGRTFELAFDRLASDRRVQDGRILAYGCSLGSSATAISPRWLNWAGLGESMVRNKF